MTEQDHMVTLTVTAVSAGSASNNTASGQEFYLHERNDFLEPEWYTGDVNGDADLDKLSWAYNDNSCQDVESTIRT